MQVSVESGEGLLRKMTVEVPSDSVNEKVEKRLKEISRQVRLDGFRPGKVPMRVVKQRFGQQARQEVFGDIIQSTFYEAASQEKLQPAGEPSIEIKNDDAAGAFSYIASFEVVPTVEVADLSGAEVEKIASEVTDADVDAMFDKLRKQRTQWNEVERASQDGDKLDINFKGIMDGEVFEGGSAENAPLVLGSGAMIDGFESGLLGATKGDERTLELKFPDEYHAEHLAGKDVTFEVTVNSVSEPQLPEIDAEFAKSLGVESGEVEELRNEVRTNMDNELEQKTRSMLKEKVMDLLIEKHDFDVPDAMVKQEAERMKEQTKADMQSRGQASNLDLPASIFEEQAKRRVKLGMIVGEIISKQELKADDDKIRATIERFAASYESPDEVVEYYMNNPQQKASLESLVLEDEVVDWVLGQVKVSEKSMTFDELMN
jgi:trigger factor